MQSIVGDIDQDQDNDLQ